MKMRKIFGQLLLNVSKRLKNWSERLGKEGIGTARKTVTDYTSSGPLIWGITEGPFSRDDFPEEELEDMGIPDTWQFMMVAKCEEHGKMGHVNLWYETLDEALKVKYYFDNNIEPLELES